MITGILLTWITCGLYLPDVAGRPHCENMKISSALYLSPKKACAAIKKNRIESYEAHRVIANPLITVTEVTLQPVILSCEDAE